LRRNHVLLRIVGADTINACDIGEKIIAIGMIPLKLCYPYPYKRFSTNDTIIHCYIYNRDLWNWWVM